MGLPHTGWARRGKPAQHDRRTHWPGPASRRHGQRCHSGHCVANGSHSAIPQWLRKRIAGECRAACKPRHGAPHTERGKPHRGASLPTKVPPVESGPVSGGVAAGGGAGAAGGRGECADDIAEAGVPAAGDHAASHAAGGVAGDRADGNLVTTGMFFAGRIVVGSAVEDLCGTASSDLFSRAYRFDIVVATAWGIQNLCRGGWA